MTTLKPKTIHLSMDDLSKTLIKKLDKYSDQTIKKRKLALVFDLDETLLLNITKDQVVGSPALSKLFHYAKRRHFYVFFVTARFDMDNVRVVTLHQLQKAKLVEFDGLFLQPPEFDAPGVTWSLFKYLTRLFLKEQGFHIVLNIGDQWSDLFLEPCFTGSVVELSDCLKKDCKYCSFEFLKLDNVVDCSIKLAEDPFTHLVSVSSSSTCSSSSSLK